MEHRHARGLVFEAAALPTVLSLVPIQTQILTQLQNVPTGAGLVLCLKHVPSVTAELGEKGEQWGEGVGRSQTPIA